jgi:hypothetical protein
MTKNLTNILLAAGLSAAFGYSIGTNAYAGEPAQASEAQEKKEKPKVFRLKFVDVNGKTEAVEEPVEKPKEKPQPKQPVQPVGQPKPQKPSEPKDAVKPAKPLPAQTNSKNLPAQEYSLKGSYYEGTDVKSFSEELKVRNLQNRDKLRYEAGVRSVQQSDAKEKEGSAFGDVYKTFDGYGLGASAEGGNKILSGKASGHKDFANGDVRLSLYAGGSQRKDNNIAEPYDLETKTKTDSVMVGGSLKLKTTENTDLTLGSAYQESKTNITIDGTVLGQTISMKDSVDSKVLTNYAIFTLKNPDENSSLKGAHIGVIYTQNENTSSEDTNKDLIIIGGISYKLTKTTTGIFTGKAGSQNGGGIKLVIGPDVEKLAGLYNKLNQIQDRESEEFKSTMKEVDLAVRNVNTKIISIDYSKDRDTETNMLKAGFEHTFQNGFKYKLGAGRSWDKETKFYELSAGIGYDGVKCGFEVNGTVSRGDFDDKKVELILKYKK